MSFLIHPALVTTGIIVALFVFVGWLAENVRAAEPEPLGPAAWIGRANWMFCGIGGAAMLAVGIGFLTFWWIDLGGLAFATFGLILCLCAVVTLIALHRGYAVGWTDKAVRGPASYLRPPGRKNIAEVRFDEIQEIGIDVMQHFFVLDVNGQSVRWTACHDGWVILFEAIKDSRPDLLPPVVYKALMKKYRGA